MVLVEVLCDDTSYPGNRQKAGGKKTRSLYPSRERGGLSQKGLLYIAASARFFAAGEREKAALMLRLGAGETALAKAWVEANNSLL